MKRNRLLHDPLLLWQFRQLMPVNSVALVVTIVYVLLCDTPLLVVDNWTILIAIVVHSGMIVITLGRLSTPASAFLYSQGFARDQIWNSKLVASMLSAMLICGVTWLLMVTRIRSLVQDHFFQHPYFPMIAPEEFSLPWIVLPCYLLILASMHYVWIRSALPYRGGESGGMLMVLCLALISWTFDRVIGHRDHTAILLTVAALHLPAAIVLLEACRNLHRIVEVRS